MRKLIFLLAFLFSLPVFGQVKVLTNNGVVLTNNGVVLTTGMTPDGITGLEFWYDGKDASTFSLNVNKVIQWDDKSGNARHIPNAVDANRPTWSSVTGRVTFVAASSTYLQSAAFGPLTQPNTIFIVAKITGGLGDTEAIFDGITDPVAFYMLSNSFRINAGTDIQGSATDANDNIHVGEFNGASSKYYINGVLEASGNAGASTLQGVTLGSDRTTSSLNSDAEIMEVFGYNKVLSTSDRQALEAYLTSKWGL